MQLVNSTWVTDLWSPSKLIPDYFCGESVSESRYHGMTCQRKYRNTTEFLLYCGSCTGIGFLSTPNRFPCIKSVLHYRFLEFMTSPKCCDGECLLSVVSSDLFLWKHLSNYYINVPIVVFCVYRVAIFLVLVSLFNCMSTNTCRRKSCCTPKLITAGVRIKGSYFFPWILIRKWTQWSSN